MRIALSPDGLTAAFGGFSTRRFSINNDWLQDFFHQQDRPLAIIPYHLTINVSTRIPNLTTEWSVDQDQMNNWMLRPNVWFTSNGELWVWKLGIVNLYMPMTNPSIQINIVSPNFQQKDHPKSPLPSLDSTWFSTAPDTASPDRLMNCQIGRDGYGTMMNYAAMHKWS